MSITQRGLLHWRGSVLSYQYGIIQSRNSLITRRTYAAATATTEKSLDEKTKNMVRALEDMERRALPASYDPDAMPVPLLDLVLPMPYSRVPKENKLKGTIAWARTWLSNFSDNAFHLFYLTKSASFIGLPGSSSPPKPRWTPQLFKTQSTSPKTWLAPLRQHALNQYLKMSEAQATGDLRTLGSVTKNSQFHACQKRIKDRSKDHLFVWNYYGEKSPARILSIRTAIEGDDKAGSSRGIVQALLKFDTLQSLSVYNKKTGKLLQSRGTKEEPARVIEYMVLEKRVETESPWVIRNQLLEGVNAKYEELF